MKDFAETHGLVPGPVEMRKNKMVAAMFDDGSGKAWYRAKVLERPGADGSAMALFVDYGNVAKIVVKQVRMLDPGLDTAFPPAAKPATLALVRCRELNQDEGPEAARTLSRLAFGKELTLRVHTTIEGVMHGTLYVPREEGGGGSRTNSPARRYEVSNSTSINEQLVEDGLARCISDKDAAIFARNSQASVLELHGELKDAQEKARKARIGIWVYGDVGEDDDETARY
jgi:staphylococcal nuclease domain-containing protein 1